MDNIKNKYVIALPSFKGDKSFNNQTILISAKNEIEAMSIARELKPHSNIGAIKKVDY